METRQKKRTKKAPDSPVKLKVQDLPLLCVEAICKFTPTSKLASLYSKAVPLPGAFWNFGLKTVLKKRLPLTLADHGRDTNVLALVDSSCAKVANVEHPEALRFSPLCEFVQSTTLAFRVLPAFACAEPRLRYVISDPPESLLPHLRNLRELTLIDHGDFAKPYPAKTSDDKDFLLPALKDVLPQLECFTWYGTDSEKRKMLNKYLVEMLPVMAGLKRVEVPDGTLHALFRAASAGSESSEALRRALSGLRWIRLQPTGRFLNIVSVCCAQLTHLCVMLVGDLKPHLNALRALVSLSTLGLQLVNIRTTGIAFNEGEAITSVLELSLTTYGPCDKGEIASLFPNVKTAILKGTALATELCEKRVWPKLESLCCFSGPFDRDLTSAQFLASLNQPRIVDLSLSVDENLVLDSSRLTDVYRAMQSGPIETLLLRGPLHREALPRLQAYIDLNGESAKIIAWKDRDLRDQPYIVFRGEIFVPAREFSPNTDVRIIGKKENGGQFAIRVLNNHTKFPDIFV